MVAKKGYTHGGRVENFEGKQGKRKGVPNKTTRHAKDAIMWVFDEIELGEAEGDQERVHKGRDAFKHWAQTNPGEFYTKMYVKLLPLEIKAQADVSMVVQVVKFAEAQEAE